MIYCYRTDVSEEIEINKTSKSNSNTCNICHYCYFWKEKRFKFQSHVCNRCHNLVIESVNLGDIATLNIKGADFLGLSTSESMTLIQNTDLTEKSGTLQNIQIHYHL